MPFDDFLWLSGCTKIEPAVPAQQQLQVGVKLVVDGGGEPGESCCSERAFYRSIHRAPLNARPMPGPHPETSRTAPGRPRFVRTCAPDAIAPPLRTAPAPRPPGPR